MRDAAKVGRHGRGLLSDPLAPRQLGEGLAVARSQRAPRRPGRPGSHLRPKLPGVRSPCHIRMALGGRPFAHLRRSWSHGTATLRKRPSRSARFVPPDRQRPASNARLIPSVPERPSGSVHPPAPGKQRPPRCAPWQHPSRGAPRAALFTRRPSPGACPLASVPQRPSHSAKSRTVRPGAPVRQRPSVCARQKRPSRCPQRKRPSHGAPAAAPRRRPVSEAGAGPSSSGR